MTDEPTRVQAALLEWGADQRRDLPWRQTRDPWAILVSEVMLQQTQAARVADRFGDFLAAFPTPRACARAGRAAVIRAWEGLGYNRRAVNLHRTATRLVDQHGGRVPDDLSALLDLPGIGPYTARAVLAFAFEDDRGVVDVNAGRVLARLVAGRRLTRGEAQDLADELVPRGRGWEWNQAVLDLGALVCTRSDPDCPHCPVQQHCGWQQAAGDMPDPATGGAGESGRQGRFEGSDRQGRGRLVDSLRTGPVTAERIPDAAGWPEQPVRARRVADALVAEGLAEYADGMLTLPA